MNRERSLMYVGASILVGVIVLIFLAKPEYDNMILAKEGLDEQRQELAAVEQENADTDKLIADYNNTPDFDIDEVNKFIPPNFGQADFIAQMEAIGKDTQAFVTGISFAIPEEGSDEEAGELGVSELLVELDVTGGYAEIMDFITSVEQSKRISTLNDVRMGSEGGSLVSRISLTTYFKDSGVKQDISASAPVDRSGTIIDDTF